ncbi:MAG: HAMP domain-containing sensor histidine kinase [Oscillospiraceae bacterium]
MDTKWKKFRNNTALKVVAFILACVFAFLTFYAGLNVISFASEFSNKGGVSKLFSEVTDSSFTNSIRFSTQLDSDMDALHKMVTEYKSDENVYSGNAFAKVETDLKIHAEEDIAQRIIDEKKNVIESVTTFSDEGNIEYNFTNDQNAEKFTTSNNTNNFDDEEVVMIDGVGFYRGIALDGIVVNEQQIRKDVEDNLKSEINNRKHVYRAGYEENKKNISKIKNLNFAIRNKDTGEVYTNMGDVVKSDTDLMSLASGDNWSMAIDKGNFSYGSKVEQDNNYYADSKYVSMLSTLFDKNGYDAYFSISSSSNTFKEGDAYYDLQEDYENRLVSFEDMRTQVIINSILMLAMIILLCVGAGKLDDEGKTKKAKIDKIYNDLHFIISLVLVVCGIVGTIGVYESFLICATPGHEYTTSVSLCAMIGVATVAVITEWLMSVVRHVRCSTYFKNTLFYVIFIKNAKRLVSMFKKYLGKLKELFSFQNTKNLKTRMIKIICCYAGANVVLAMLFSMTAGGYDPGWHFIFGVLMIGVNISLVATAKQTIQALDDMMEALIQAENGKFDFDLNIYSMPLYLRDFASHILNLREGMKIAVDEAIKGERMKAELITNVSHDLKTPLTSIVNYVDLLKRCELNDDTAQSYITILEEKAERLKKLIEDLVEASKVSTGNVQMNITKVNLNELSAQLAGETEEELKDLGIDLRVSAPDTPVIVKADSQKAYRAIENLFSNVKKYTMPGTRVYVDVGTEGNLGYISVKNISKDELDVPVDQLTQRFVRGDSARTSEGSGLGLSIADNLIALQNGEFILENDGDLFKATVRLPLDE